MKNGMLFLMVCFAVVVSASAVQADNCSQLSDWRQREVCKGNCSAAEDWRVREACKGNCSSIEDWRVREACKGNCSSLENWEHREACKSCGGGGQWAALYLVDVLRTCR